jgi:hypothetical protein
MKKQHMNKSEFLSFFWRNIVPDIREKYEKDGVVDRVARRECWHNLVDAMVKDGSLHERARDWTVPW